ncbi:MAG: glutaredoxin 3 [Alphaproteobacteria bacterium]|nr:glutaredoxin 3 [Alphaproteobacteria bacterium]
MARVEIYTRLMCGFCARAKKLLDRKGAKYEEIDVTFSDRLREEMMERAEGRNTVPQIFIDGQGIGGCGELYALDGRGELDRLLTKAA